jgi:hypothetical protein
MPVPVNGVYLIKNKTLIPSVFFYIIKMDGTVSI